MSCRARLLVLVLALLPVQAAADELSARARRLHRTAIVVDTHIDAPEVLWDDFEDLGRRGATPHFDIARAREGGLGAAFMSIFVDSSYGQAGTAGGRALELIDLTRRVVAAHPRELVLAVSVADIRHAHRDGKLALLMGVEGGDAIEDSLGALRELHHAGVRYLTLTHTSSNHWADSAGAYLQPDYEGKPAALHGGLTDFGRDVVREMNRLGMMIDVSHASADTVADVLEASRAPVMASHSSCRALSDTPRNLTDEQIRAIGGRGGVVMVNFSSAFIDGELYGKLLADRQRLAPEVQAIKQKHAGDPQGERKALRALFDARPVMRARWTRIVDHIDHVILIAGPDSVGLGSDFDGIDDPPEGMDDVSMLPRLTEEMLRRGYSDAQVRKVLGENFLAFFARVEAAARQAH